MCTPNQCGCHNRPINDEYEARCRCCNKIIVFGRDRYFAHIDGDGYWCSQSCKDRDIRESIARALY